MYKYLNLEFRRLSAKQTRFRATPLTWLMHTAYLHRDTFYNSSPDFYHTPLNRGY